MYFPIFINWTSPFPFLGLLGVICLFFFNSKFKRNICKETMENLIRFTFAASGLVLHCLPMSHKKDARLIWVNLILVWHPGYETFSMLNSIENENHVCRCWTMVGILTFISMINTASESLKARKKLLFQHFSFFWAVKISCSMSFINCTTDNHQTWI